MQLLPHLLDRVFGEAAAGGLEAGLVTLFFGIQSRAKRRAG
jgi:hypothetical protein